MFKEKIKNIYKKGTTKDLLCIAIFVLTYLVILLVKTGFFKYLPGSMVDFDIQHYTLPDYFRTLFYKDFDLFPDFAFNLGAGQNIYNFSYYGLLNPIILISYLLPNVDMLDYIFVSMGIIVILSAVLFYYYLKKNNYSRFISFLGGFLLLCAGPLIYHSHRHIMFISYMPFMIMGMFGIDRYISKKKSGLLIASLALMIFTSYYYSVAGLIALFIYGIFKYMRVNGLPLKSNLKQYFKFSMGMAVRFGTAVLISGVLILPTFYVLLTGRSGTMNSVSLFDLFVPQMYMLYGAYAMGLTAISLIAVLYMVRKDKKENRLLSWILLLISVVPIFCYILNATLYINAKALIPFVPVALINTADFMKIRFEEYKADVIYRNRYKRKHVMGACVVLSAFVICNVVNYCDKLMTSEQTFDNFKADYSESVANLTESEDLYRINSTFIEYIYSDKFSGLREYKSVYTNKVINAQEYKTTMYSSTYNGDYKNAFVELFENPLPQRTEFVIWSDNNPLFQMYMGEKYLYSTEKMDSLYKELQTFESGITLYENPYVLPIGYATHNYISQTDFENLSYPSNIINMLGNAVTDKATNTSLIEPVKIDNLQFEILSSENIKNETTDFGYILNVEKDASVQLKLTDEALKGKLLIIAFDVTPQKQDLYIEINGVQNILSDTGWKYYNGNTTFSYVLYNEDNMLDIDLNNGYYEIQNANVHVLDFNAVKNINQTIDPFVIDKNLTKGDNIVGVVNAQEDSCFVLSVPYDKGFTVYIDGNKTPYYKANQTFIGFDISQGEHKIEITYDAPLKREGMIISIAGIVLFIGVAVFEFIKSKKAK